MATSCAECKEIQDQFLSLTSVMFSYFPSTISGSHLNSSPPHQTPMVPAIPRKINSIWLLLSPPFFHHAYLFGAVLLGLWDLISPTRNWIRAPTAKVSTPNHWTAREFPCMPIFWLVSGWYKVGESRKHALCTIILKEGSRWFLTYLFTWCSTQIW